MITPTGPLRVTNADALVPTVRAGLAIAELPEFIAGEYLHCGSSPVHLSKGNTIMQPGKFPEGTSDGSDHLWFLDTSVVIRVRHTDGADQISVLEHLAPYGDSPPLHLHQDEDEIFHVLEGELRFRVGAENLSLKAGDTLLAPKRVPHTYKVESTNGARFLTVTRGDGFEGLVQEFGRHAEHEGLPDPAGPPTPEQAGALADACLRHGIELVGPPLA